MPPIFQRSAEDVGNIVEFGHVNVRVPQQQQALVFYAMGLGLTRDPYQRVGISNAWMNIGSSQFHLPLGRAEVVRGSIGLVMQDLDALVLRLAEVAPLLSGTQFGFERLADLVEVRCPWGNRIRVHAPERSRFGPLLLGIAYVQIDCAPHSAAGIARFYTEILGAPASTHADAQGRYARVPAGLHGCLLFRETSSPLAAYDGHHVQISVADFSGPYQRLLARGLVTEESSQSQYRFQDIVDLDSGQVLATLEHEVRSMRHPMYGRQLVNRNLANHGDAYMPGYEEAAWGMPPTA